MDMKEVLVGGLIGVVSGYGIARLQGDQPTYDSETQLSFKNPFNNPEKKYGNQLKGELEGYFNGELANEIQVWAKAHGELAKNMMLKDHSIPSIDNGEIKISKMPSQFAKDDEIYQMTSETLYPIIPSEYGEPVEVRETELDWKNNEISIRYKTVSSPSLYIKTGLGKYGRSYNPEISKKLRVWWFTNILQLINDGLSENFPNVTLTADTSEIPQAMSRYGDSAGINVLNIRMKYTI